jgi:hypothetical protein
MERDVMSFSRTTLKSLQFFISAQDFIDIVGNRFRRNALRHRHSCY